jgi:RNA polymerase sigma-54 factor
MEMRQDMRPELGQHLVMTPKLQQAIKLLQVPALELQQMLKQELMTNPMLEEPDENEDLDQEEKVEEIKDDDDGELKTREDEIDWDRYLRDGFEYSSRDAGESEEREGGLERVPVSKYTLEEHLLSQLRMATPSDEDMKIGEFIIGSLNGDGFLTISAEEIAGLLSADIEKVQKVLALIKTFDPSGVGARDLRECLLIQLAQQGQQGTLAWTLVEEYFDELIQRRYPEIAKKLKTDVAEVQVAEEVIGKLDPRPGSRYASDEPRYIVPDLIVEKVDDDYVVQLNDRNVPRLRISRAYKNIMTGAKARSKKEYEYVKDKLNSAAWLIRTIDQRRRTMIKVMEEILDVQREFFDRGIEHLKPLTLQQIAERVDMHESTVSRVTNSKYVQTPRGVFELKYFFSTGLKTDNGEVASSRKIKARIAEIIDKEDKRKPLSDQTIAKMLQNDGFQVARRTVAKYRDRLGVLPARMRKQY